MRLQQDALGWGAFAELVHRGGLWRAEFAVRIGHRVLLQNAVSPNGPHLRPRADLSARGRVALTRERGSVARGHALYVSRRAACVCWATVVSSSGELLGLNDQVGQQYKRD
jgi:hypothetical protein